MANTYLTRTNSSPTNAKKYTWSSWNKIDSGGWYPFFSTTHQGGHSYIGFGASGSSFGVIEHGDSAGTLYYLSTSSIQRDTSGWYHVVVQFDSTQSTASDRIKIYINNVLQTSFGNSDYPSQNLDSWFVDATTIEIGRRSQGSGQYYSGLISHAHFIDGTVYAPSTFGETDSTTGEWKIKTDPGISTANYGNNGFWMFKDNNSLNDNSGNGNNFSLGGGTLTKTEDNPSNVFCTWNPLDNFYQESTFAHGNTQVRGKSPGIQYGYETFNTGTLGMTSGKYYWEIKFSANDSGATEIGIVDNVTTSSSQQLQQRTYGWSYSKDGTVKNNSSSVGGTWGTYTTGDIIGVALNLDDEQDGLNKLYFSKNGVWQNGSDPSNASSVTGVVGVTKPENNSSGFYFPAGGDENAGNSTLQANFGNGYFGTTAVSSAGTNASGIGIFEYDVPTGYTALSTKGLNL
jgi:hypothetical protein